MLGEIVIQIIVRGKVEVETLSGERFEVIDYILTNTHQLAFLTKDHKVIVETEIKTFYTCA